MKIEINRASDYTDKPERPVDGATWRDVTHKSGRVSGFWWIEVASLEELCKHMKASGHEWVLSPASFCGDETVLMRATVYDAYL